MSDSPEDPRRAEAVERPDRAPTPPVPRPDAGVAPGRSSRAPRRAVRRAGTVGTDESVLRSTHPAAPVDDPTGALTPALSADEPRDPAVPLRALDDTDVGWGRDADSNDDRLHRDRPPHW